MNEHRIIKYRLALLVVLLALSCQSKNETDEQSDRTNEYSTSSPSEDLDPAAKPIPDTITVEAKDYVFLPPDLEVIAGEPVLIKVINNGNHAHSMKIVLPGDTIEFDAPIPMNSARFLKFTAPQQTGTYRFYCPMRNDSMLGMKGQLIVSEEK